MRVPKQEIPVKIDVPGAVARQTEYFSLGAGTDIAPLLQGLEHDACQAPHWGYVISGEAVVTYTDGAVETCAGGDLFYWPSGHGARVVNDAEVILFSPRQDHLRVMNHMISQMAEA